MRFNASSLVRRIILWCGAFAVSVTAYAVNSEHTDHIASEWKSGGAYRFFAGDIRNVEIIPALHGSIVTNAVLDVYTGVPLSYCFVPKAHNGYSFSNWLVGGQYLDVHIINGLNVNMTPVPDLGNGSNHQIEFAEWNKDYPNPSTKTDLCFENLNKFSFKAEFTNNVYTVSFDTGVEGEVESAEVTYDKAYGELPTVTHEGKRLDGWYLNDKKIEESTIVKTADDHTLVARFSDIPYLTLQFNLNYEGAPENPEPMKFETGGLYSNLPVPAERDEYIFLGWYIGGRKLRDGDKVELSGECRADAVWERVPSYPIDLTIDDTVSAVYYQTKNTEAGVWTLFNFIRPPEVMSNSFVRLYAKANPGYTALNPKTDPLVIEHVQPTIVSGDKVIAIQLKTKPNDYTIALDAKGGEVEPSSISVTMDKAYGELPTPTRRGYTFEKWVDEEGAEVVATKIFSKAEAGTLSAVWKANEYTVSFEANLPRAVGTMSEVSAVYDSEITLPQNEYYHADYKFAGWSLKADKFEELPSPVKNLTDEDGANVTLYATWEKKSDEERGDLAVAADASNVVLSNSNDRVEYRRFSVTDKSAFIGDKSVRGAVYNAQDTSRLYAEVRGTGVLSFAWKFAAEEGDEVYLETAVHVDNNPIQGLGATSEWTKASVMVEASSAANKHDIVWSIKNTQSSQGGKTWLEDYAYLYLDDISFLPMSEEESEAYQAGEDAWKRYLVSGNKDDESELKADITFDETGKPVISWKPNLGPKREYIVEGKASLEDAAWHKAREGDRFFRVKVELK